MDEATFQSKLPELMGEVSSLPKAERDKLTDVAAEVQERHEKLKKTVNDLQESLDYLRLAIKYMVFDVEATRREKKRWKEQTADLHVQVAELQDEIARLHDELADYRSREQHGGQG